MKDVLENQGLKKGTIDAIKSGAIFIYPTDTVYGIGCNAENGKSVQKLRKIKRTGHPFSVIAPSKKWIRHELDVNVSHSKYLKKLPGPYTLIFHKKVKGFLSEAAPGASLGVRIPKHHFTGLVASAGVPFVTTSANISGKPTIKSVKNIPEQMFALVDYVIDGGALVGKPSKVIDLTEGTPRIIRK
jgi:L-threonylcarbamoyladenylate synthase